MKKRPILMAAIAVFLIALVGAQVWVLWRQQDLRERHQVAHQEALARWNAQPKVPGGFYPPPPTYYEPPPMPPIFLTQVPMIAAAALAAAYGQKKRKERENE